PDHPREGLALHEPRVGVADRLLDDVVERVRFVAPVLDERVEAGEWRGMLRAAQPQPDAPRPAGRDGPAVVDRGLGANGQRVHGPALAADDEVVDPVLEVTGGALDSKDATDVGLVVAEERTGLAVEIEL